MKVVWSDAAARDLDDIIHWLEANHPGIGRAVEQRVRAVVAQIARWPDSTRRSTYRPDVRIAPLGRYPYRIFYRMRDDAAEILHIHHAARDPWDEQA
jgi:plasmid stabilization system protein ParE